MAHEAPSNVLGALQGTQQRGWVTCRIDALLWERNLIAIFADPTPLALPNGVDGIAGLAFLRQFDAWGAAQTAGSAWQFYLSLLAA